MKQRIRGRIKLNFRSGFTLIEVFVVLVIVSLFISIATPSIENLLKKNKESFDNLLKANIQTSSSICADFNGNDLRLDNTTLDLPRGFKLVYAIIPGKLASSKYQSSFCMNIGSKPSVIGMVVQSNGSYLGYLILTATREIIKWPLTEAGMETFKDKVLKGRMADWFNYCSSLR